MKASIEKVKSGLTTFIDGNLINHLEGWQKIGVGAAAALLIRNLPATVEKYAKHPFVVALGIIDDDLNVDIDALHDAVADYFLGDGEYINVPVIGRVKITKEDVEGLYQSIKEA